MCGYVCTCGGQRMTFHQVDPGAGGLTQVCQVWWEELYHWPCSVVVSRQNPIM